MAEPAGAPVTFPWIYGAWRRAEDWIPHGGSSPTGAGRDGRRGSGAGRPRTRLPAPACGSGFSRWRPSVGSGVAAMARRPGPQQQYTHSARSSAAACHCSRAWPRTKRPDAERTAQRVEGGRECRCGGPLGASAGTPSTEDGHQMPFGVSGAQAGTKPPCGDLTLTPGLATTVRAREVRPFEGLVSVPGFQFWLLKPLLTLLATGEPVAPRPIRRRGGPPRRGSPSDACRDARQRVRHRGSHHRPRPHRQPRTAPVRDRRSHLLHLVRPGHTGPSRHPRPQRASDLRVPGHRSAGACDRHPGPARRRGPATAVISLIDPAKPASVRSSFCNQIHFSWTKRQRRGGSRNIPTRGCCPSPTPMRLSALSSNGSNPGTCRAVAADRPETRAPVRGRFPGTA